MAKNDQVLGPKKTQLQAGINKLHFAFLGDPALRLPLPTANVIIDSISHATGTPQNDSLEKWKARAEMHYIEMSKMRNHIAYLKAVHDSVQEKVIIQRADSFHLAYKNYTRQLAKNMEGLVLGDFLKELFPLTYKRKLPDGRIVTMNADTNEEIPE